MLNLYEILEVSEKASKEVIEKAYRVLAKKYHPDLQSEENRKNAEKKMKQINEAYEILSDEEKRKQYDIELQQEREEQKRREQIELQKRQENTQREETQTVKQEEQWRRQNEEENNINKLNNEIKRTYTQAYNQYFKNQKNNTKEPWTKKRIIELLKVFGILAIIILVLWIFPPTHKLIVDFYEGNAIVKVIVNLLGNIIVGLCQGIQKFFSNLL